MLTSEEDFFIGILAGIIAGLSPYELIMLMEWKLKLRGKEEVNV